MALDITFHNIDLDLAALREQSKAKLEGIGEPVFSSYKEDIAALRQQLKDFDHYQNILLVGNGGSIWSFMPLYTALADKVNGKKVVLLTDMEPDYLTTVRATYAPEDSLVVVVSKSGSTVGVIENLFYFHDYPQLYVTDPGSTLGELGKRLGVPMIVHPSVGGRYSTFTSCAYVPAILAGLDVEGIETGGRTGYEAYGQADTIQNDARDMALFLYELENRGYTELFLPIYSNFLQTFGMIATQLFHESFGKDGKGFTVLAAQAPESQHHTNQRFFGGRKNMVGCFLHVTKQGDSAATVSVPEQYRDIPLRSGKLGDIDGVSYTDAYAAEYLGTFTDAKQQQIPLIDIAVSEVSAQTVGTLMAFWHYTTVYSAILRGVDPYDQPQVENSKVISFQQRLAKRQV
jgi:glucose-6-phosphate isomerase